MTAESGAATASTAGAESAGDVRGPAIDPALLAYCNGQQPIVCQLPAPNGNYDVTLELGVDAAATPLLAAAETRHIIGHDGTNQSTERWLVFTVNVRAEAHDGGQSAPGDVLDIVLEGSSPQLQGLGLRPAPDAATVFVIGDSTVCDWVGTNASAITDDETGWGQALAQYFEPGVAVANYADSGETAASFYSKFFPAARAAMKAGDYLFIQFGHNDQKNTAAVESYQQNLLRYAQEARDRQVSPVLFTPVSRATGTDADPGFAGLDEQVRELARAEGIALVDLSVLSRQYYRTVPDKSALFVDSGTHLSTVGANAVAGLVAGALAQSSLELSALVRQ